MGTVIGQVAALARFPVKSMAGEALQEARLDWRGIEGDRQYAFVKSDDRGRFPWFTGRDHAPLVRYRPRFADPQQPKSSAVEVEAPDGWRGAIEDPMLLARLEAAGGKRLALIQLGRGAFDAMPVSLASTAGHATLEMSHGALVDKRRFRINILIDSDLPMRVWQGRRLSLGAAEVTVAEPIQRCVMITIDPDTAERDPWIMRTVAQQFGNTYGVYANPSRTGAIRVGDEVRLET